MWEVLVFRLVGLVFFFPLAYLRLCVQVISGVIIALLSAACLTRQTLKPVRQAVHLMRHKHRNAEHKASFAFHP